MGFGDIIKKAWHITWRYKALWVLGIFAGISGCQSSFGGNSSYRTSSGRTTTTSAANPFGELTPPGSRTCCPTCGPSSSW